MSAPLYNLIVVNERVLFGKAPFAVDRYFENIIRGAAVRCYVYQLTALVTGILLIPLGGLSYSALLENPVLLGKLLLLVALMTLLSVVHFKIQPAIESLLGRVDGDEIPAKIAEGIAPLRLRRKRLAAVCLFIVITVVLLSIQIYKQFGLPINILLVTLSALFSYRVYRTPVRFGWI
ncbi:MAG: hypothetical protein GTN76_03300 [Candidatus Aenigmarchaeota archaeon]|nr:hypothetical protein [Candidatus Aenigmarchaeota archaeon]